MVTSGDYRPVPLPSAETLETIEALYLTAGSGMAARTHLRIPGEAYRLSRRVRSLLDAGEPSGYGDSEQRLAEAVALVDQAQDFSNLIVDLVGDTALLLPVANKALALLAEYAAGCEAADGALRAAIHDSFRSAA